MTKQILLSLLNCSWQWGLLGGLMWLITRRFRQSNSITHLLWLMFLLSLPILFTLNQFVPAPSFSNAIPKLLETQAMNQYDLVAPETDLSTISLIENNTKATRNNVSENSIFLNQNITGFILCIWAVGTLFMLIRLSLGLYRIRQLRCNATVANDSYQSICKRLVQKMNINRPINVCVSDQILSPISFGWLSPHILIPRNLTLDQFELVAAHELAHIQRLDWLTNIFSHIIGAIFFFHPLYHLLNGILARLRERICDDWVIQLTGARKKYAQCLLDLVRHIDREIPLALTFNEPSWLESRIDQILKHNRRLDLQTKQRTLIFASIFLLTFLPLLSMAQLIPLRTVQLSLFTQTSQESEERVDKPEMMQVEQKVMINLKEKKEYKPIETNNLTTDANTTKVRLVESVDNTDARTQSIDKRITPDETDNTSKPSVGTLFDDITEENLTPEVIAAIKKYEEAQSASADVRHKRRPLLHVEPIDWDAIGLLTKQLSQLQQQRKDALEILANYSDKAFNELQRIQAREKFADQIASELEEEEATRNAERAARMAEHKANLERSSKESLDKLNELSNRYSEISDTIPTLSSKEQTQAFEELRQISAELSKMAQETMDKLNENNSSSK